MFAEALSSPPLSTIHRVAEILVVSHQSPRNYQHKASTLHNLDDERLGIRKKEEKTNREAENE
jgi:hypothetical protein